ncbi:PAB-dependent poly(A)-specific ribonuclease subunit 3 [Trichinella nativa]|uniref:PAN2-PAN3 deadenylation complex subunit PAN3 n=1 Tax=Trichinella nativa TaxID=6335 RepID=A0A0V1LV97_9BILA|nr:PAB-dependent poly(A)-specific ribonuclease subunit 3 [Trichinella nativa]
MNYSQSVTNATAGSSRTEHAAANAHHQHSAVFTQYQTILSRPAFQSSLCNRSVKMGTSYFTADPNCRFPNSNGSFKCDSNMMTESGSKWLYGNHVVDYPLNLSTNNSTSQSIVYMPHHRTALHSCDSSSSLRFQTPAKNQSVLPENCESSDSVIEGQFIEKFANFSLNKVTTSAEVGRVDFGNTLSNRYDVFGTANVEYSQFNAVSAGCNTLTTSSLYNYTGKDHQGNNCFVEHDCINGVTYFYSNEGQKSFPYDGSAAGHYLYNGAPSYLSNPAYCKSDASCFSICAELKAELQARQQLNCPHSYSYEYHDVPQKVDNYYKLLPLEEVTTNPMMQQNGYFCLVTTAYKAVLADDGLYYCLRRLHGFRVVNSNALSAVYQWKTKVSSPNVVGVKEAFTNKAFGDNSLIFVFDYYPGAETLKSRHFSSQKQCKSNNNFQNRDNITTYDPTSKNSTVENKPIAENLLWSYVINICSALRVIHSAGLAARTIDPSKILVVGKSRILLNCCSIFDVLTFEQTQNNHVLISRYQQDDLVGLGQLIFSLACGNLSPLQQANFASSMEFLSRHYSADLKNLILYLLHGQRSKNVMEIMPMIGARFFSHLDSWLMRVDMLENELIKEMENGRLFRILCKLATVNERPILGMDPQWSETGDRYLLKLFRDYVFHQVTEDGSPWLDLGHIIQCLNKLDAGVAEKIMLMSRDEQNVLIVSFADLHRCLDQSFTEIVQNTCQGVTS